MIKHCILSTFPLKLCLSGSQRLVCWQNLAKTGWVLVIALPRKLVIAQIFAQTLRFRVSWQKFAFLPWTLLSWEEENYSIPASIINVTSNTINDTSNTINDTPIPSELAKACISSLNSIWEEENSPIPTGKKVHITAHQHLIQNNRLVALSK